jgi:hypothetical protein
MARFMPFRDYYVASDRRALFRRDPVRYGPPRSSINWSFARGEFGVSFHCRSGDRPAEEQFDALSQFREFEREYVSAIMAAVYDYYCTQRPSRVRELPPDDAQFAMPPLDDASGLHELLSLLMVHVHSKPATGGAPVALGFEFSCTWDSRNGLGVRWRDGKVEQVGFVKVAKPT